MAGDTHSSVVSPPSRSSSEHYRLRFDQQARPTGGSSTRSSKLFSCFRRSKSSRSSVDSRDSVVATGALRRLQQGHQQSGRVSPRPSGRAPAPQPNRPRNRLFHQEAKGYLFDRRAEPMPQNRSPKKGFFAALMGKEHGNRRGGKAAPNPYANFFPFGASKRPAVDNDAVFPTYTLVQKLKPGGMSDAINLVRKYGKLYIEKRVRVTDKHTKHRAAAELAALQRITPHRHRNLNYYITSQWGPRDAYLSLTLEYCDGGTVQDQITANRSANKHMPESFVWHCMLGIANALAFLHAGIEDATTDARPVQDWNAICHLDLKPSNIFLTSVDKSGHYPRVVLGDFGCVVTGNDIVVGVENPKHKAMGTPGWDPPEAQRRYGVDTDVWQCGAIIQACCRLSYFVDRFVEKHGLACGRRYSAHLNETVLGAMKDDYRERSSSTKLVREAVKALELMKKSR